MRKINSDANTDLSPLSHLLNQKKNRKNLFQVMDKNKKPNIENKVNLNDVMKEVAVDSPVNIKTRKMLKIDSTFSTIEVLEKRYNVPNKIKKRLPLGDKNMNAQSNPQF